MKTETSLSHDRIVKLKQEHAALRLLNADTAPLVISFLHQIFIVPNRRAISYSELLSLLEDYLYHLGHYPRSAKEYLNEWTSHETPYLRKYYPRHSDEPEIDLMPAVEKVIEWLQGLEQKQFVGTESRLLTLFQILEDTVKNTEIDPEAKIQELMQQKSAIDNEINDIKKGLIRTYDETQIKERFYQAEDIARKLLSDFRQVEFNFRKLDRETREKIAISEKSKGELLTEIFSKHDVIRDSDQGKSFKAFWEFLMSPDRQQSLMQLLAALYDLPEVKALSPDELLAKITYYLLEAGEKVYKTNNLLAEQLRKYLDDQAFLENKRILLLIKEIEKIAVDQKNYQGNYQKYYQKNHYTKERYFSDLPDAKPSFDLVMSKTLFSPPKAPKITVNSLEDGKAEIALDALFEQTHIDETLLWRHINHCLENHSQVTLKQVLLEHPVQEGLAEVVTYVKLACQDGRSVIQHDEIESIPWYNRAGEARTLRVPKIIFTKS